MLFRSFNELPGKKYLRYVPNGDHSLKNTDAQFTLLAFYDALLRKKELPEFTWKMPQEGTLVVNTKTKPAEVKLWQATNPNARDFRLEIIGPAYKSTNLEETGEGTYQAVVEKPAKGWTAYFVELTFKNDPVPLKFTTQVAVVPDVLPFLDKVPKGTERRTAAAGN